MSALPTDAEFRIDGVGLEIDEHSPFIEQAHGVIECIVAAIEDAGDNGPVNPKLLVAAAHGAATLIGLAGLGAERLDKQRLAACH